jgi:uncharacterized membrane protein YbhN (UPF0104 family)
VGDSPRHPARRLLEVAVTAALGSALLAAGLPRVAGAQWSQIGDLLARVGPGSVAAITALWLLGLWLHTITLAAALPGLSHTRAFFLNITGSAVSNLLPLGGTAGTLVNYGACRAWGFGTGAFVRWALVTNIWDVLGRLAFPGIALLALGTSGPAEERLVGAAAGSAALLALLIGVTVLALRGDRGAHQVGRLSDHLLRVVARHGVEERAPSPRSPEAGPPGIPVPGPAEVRALEVRRAMVELIRVAWPRLTAGKVLYAAAQAALLWLCLEAVGTAPAASVVLAAFAVERVLSLAVITPGATGIVELGMTGYLVHAGTGSATAAAGVLLYRLFVIGMEVPVGGILLGWWALTRSHRRAPGRPQLATAAPEASPDVAPEQGAGAPSAAPPTGR